MAVDLGLTPRSVLEIMLKPYLDTFSDTLEGIANKKAYLDGMVESTGNAIKLKLDEASGLLGSAQTSAKAATESVASFTVSAAAIDPLAPTASAGLIANTIGSISNVKASLEVSNLQIQQATGILSQYGMPIPTIVSTISGLVQAAVTALNLIPFP